MLNGVVLVFSVFSLALGESFATVNHNSSSVSKTEGIDPNVQGICYFGRVPSVRCMFRCFMKSSTAFCDEAQCLCRIDFHQTTDNHSEDYYTSSTDVPTTVQPFSADNETALNRTEPGLHHITFLIFDLSKLFGGSEDNSTESQETDPHIIIKDIAHSQQLWTVPHILAVAILTLLTVLVVLEVLHCCRQRNHKHHHFQTVLSPPTLEKVYVHEKQ